MIPDPLANPVVQPEPSAPPNGRRARAGEGAPMPLYLLPDSAEVDLSGRLHIGGVDVLELVSEVGTPVFVYDEEHLRRRCQEARQASAKSGLRVEGVPLQGHGALAYEEGCCIDVSTGGELAVALAAGVPADRLVQHGNNKSEAELEAALAAGVGRIVVDSFDEIDRLARLSGRSGPAGRYQRPGLSRRALKLTRMSM